MKFRPCSDILVRFWHKNIVVITRCEGHRMPEFAFLGNVSSFYHMSLTLNAYMINKNDIEC